MEQNAHFQHAALAVAGCNRIFTDHGVSGTRASRPDLDKIAGRTRACMAAAAEHGLKAGRREVTADHAKVKRAHDLKTPGLTPADIGENIGASRATEYRYVSTGTSDTS